MKTKVINMRLSNEYDVFIARPGFWGNPFLIGKDGTREEVLVKYRAWLFTQPRLLAAIPQLKGRVLGCWCAPLSCHGYVLAELADISSGQAIWRCKGTDIPVDITGIMGLGNDGKVYLREVGGTGIPSEEVIWEEDA